MAALTILSVFFLSTFLFYNLVPSQFCFAIYILSPFKQMLFEETLISNNQIFELGFFSPGNSGKQYVGIWYKKISVHRVVWVANREEPFTVADSASLEIGDDGNLRLLDGKQNIVWSTNVTISSNNSEAVLLDTGNFVLRDSTSGRVLWESFDIPCDTLLPSMMIGLSTKTGERRFLSSWQSEDDPSPGKFVAGITSATPPQIFLWNGSNPYWRGGYWNGIKFIGIPDMTAAYSNGFSLIQDTKQGTQYFPFNLYNSSDVVIIVLSSTGSLVALDWIDEKKEWDVIWVSMKSSCESYGVCGPFAVCNQMESLICMCLKGFVPKSSEEWSKGNWTGGCVRQTELLCDKNMTDFAPRKEKNDGFLKLSRMKLPDFSESLYYIYDSAGCELTCLNNCSCVAYAYVIGIGCMVWTRDLIDTQEFTYEGEDLFLRLANSELGKDEHAEKLILSLTAISSIFILGILSYGFCKWRAIRRGKRRQMLEEFYLAASQDTAQGYSVRQQDLPMFDYKKIVVATNNFSITNKLGEGGFGPVYKGKLPNGQEIAVKRLSRSSGQGIEEFKNEIILISKLQHRNLVRLLGYCIQREEKLLIYQYMSNKSLDTFLFDHAKRLLIDWPKRFSIILGISKGLLYLHRDSCLRVIHRDLKVSNILLDENMNPKISDFGLARTFQRTQDLTNTHRVVGTLGYMSPEYVIGGIFSEKSDVFSFGVLLLEIVSSKRNTSFNYHEEHLNLLGYAWQLWSEGRELEFVDQALGNSVSSSEVIRCIHVGLLCVQDQANDRPAMPAVVQMLSSETNRPQPKQPSFTFQSPLNNGLRSQSNCICSVNEVTESIIEGR